MTERSGTNGQVSRTAPILPFTRWQVAASALMSNGSPNSTTRPASSGMSPSRARMVVVLPAPFAPTKPTMLPAGTRKSTRSSTVLLPYVLVKPSARIRSVMVVSFSKGRAEAALQFSLDTPSLVARPALSADVAHCRLLRSDCGRQGRSCLMAATARRLRQRGRACRATLAFRRRRLLLRALRARAGLPRGGGVLRAGALCYRLRRSCLFPAPSR